MQHWFHVPIPSEDKVQLRLSAQGALQVQLFITNKLQIEPNRTRAKESRNCYDDESCR